MSDIKTLVRGAYDVQKLRIQMGNRITGNFKVKLGQAPGASEETLDEESRNLLAALRNEEKLITTGAVVELEEDAKAKKEKKQAGIISTLLDKHFKKVAPDGELPKKSKFKGDAVISDYTELCLITQYKELEKQEARHFRNLGKVLEDYPIYTEFLEGVRGIGPAMAGVIISEIDITKAKYASSLWMYAGLDVAPDGQGRSRRKEHLVEKEYMAKDKTLQTRVGITFNPFLKTKLIGVLGSSFLRSKSPYADVYAGYKNRLENHPAHVGKTKGHRHAMSIRFAVKCFLVDLYAKWRELEGLEVHPSYQEAKLGHVHNEGRAA